MKKFLFFVVFIVSVFCGEENARGQGTIQYWALFDSTTFTFSLQDSLHHVLYPLTPLCITTDTSNIIIDTSYADSVNTHLWTIGSTNKSFFADSGAIRSIMTDSIDPYPVNANGWFVIRQFTLFCHGDYIVVSFHHKYETSLGHDGGIVEFSNDSGLTWENILNYACLDSSNLYGINDTLLSGEPAFSGISDGWILSQFEFDLTNSFCYPVNYQIRFRFKSDSIPDTLSGWIIDRINIRQDMWTEFGVTGINKQSILNIYPNPSNDALFNFPAMDEEKEYNIEVMDAMGRRVLRVPYVHLVNLSAYPKGVYFYRVSNGVEYYSGKLETD